ncbi:MAG: hypothetical protein WCJ18_05350 [Planctomycetota bacterium]
MRFTPESISILAENEVFVFGSNLAGLHGGGAAKVALERFGAERANGIGHRGQSYAIPTKDELIETLPLEEIGEHVAEFLEYAMTKPELTFLVTQIGCGLAGYSPEDIGPLFSNVPDNVVLPEAFWKHISH